MSGYIVYSSTTSRHTSGRDYAVARISRIYSVALPAVVFSVLLAAYAASRWPGPATDIASWRPFSLGDIAASLLFLNESAGFSTQLALNGPYWSLCYEVWYYVLFGVFFFVKSRWRWPLLLLVAAVAGPAILVLFPIWVLGAWLASRPRQLLSMAPMMALVVWVGAVAFIWVLNTSGIEQVIKSYFHNRVPGFWRLEASQRLFTDYAIAVALAAHLIAFAFLPTAIQDFFLRTRALWAALAGFSFTLYLFHRPVTSLAGALMPDARNDAGVAVGVTAAVLLGCWLVAFVTEHQLPAWRRGVRRVLSLIWPAPSASAPLTPRG